METFFAQYPGVAQWLLILLVGFIGWIGKRALDNNTEAIKDLGKKLGGFDSRLHAVEERMTVQEERCKVFREQFPHKGE
jgi:hypothetical protein